MTDYSAYDENLPCRNPACQSRGRPHPNCKCYHAQGGSVCADSLPHEKGCNYFAEGGEAMPEVPAPQPLPPDNIHRTLGMAAVHTGLKGLLKDAGHSKLSEPEKHSKVLHDLKSQHEWAKTPDQEGLKQHLGNRVAGHLQNQNYEKAAETFSGHPLTGDVSKKNLGPILQRLAHPLMQHEVNPEAARSSVDYLNASMKGQTTFQSEFKKLFEKEKKSDEIKENPEARKKLKEHLEEIHEKPETLFNVGGSLGHYLPEHGSALAYQSAVAVQYLEGLKPKTQQLAPLDTLESVDKMAEASYDRQLDLAENPMLVIQHTKEGTLLPQDLTTLKTIYPGLYQSVVDQTMAELVDAQSKNFEIPYKQKMSLSLLLGQPLDFTQTPEAARAILASSQNAAPASQPQPMKKGKSGATAAELKQINKVDELYETSIEARQIDRRTR